VGGAVVGCRHYSAPTPPLASVSVVVCWVVVASVVVVGSVVVGSVVVVVAADVGSTVEVVDAGGAVVVESVVAEVVCASVAGIEPVSCSSAASSSELPASAASAITSPRIEATRIMIVALTPRLSGGRGGCELPPGPADGRSMRRVGSSCMAASLRAGGDRTRLDSRKDVAGRGVTRIPERAQIAV